MYIRKAPAVDHGIQTIRNIKCRKSEIIYSLIRLLKFVYYIIHAKLLRLITNIGISSPRINGKGNDRTSCMHETRN